MHPSIFFIACQRHFATPGSLLAPGQKCANMLDVVFVLALVLGLRLEGLAFKPLQEAKCFLWLCVGGGGNE